jgi:hypothetical protein
VYGWEYGRIIICGVCYRWDGSGSIGSGGYTLVREKGIDMTDLHEQTEKRINAESEQLGGTWEDHALRKWSYWQEAHRQRCEEIEKLQKEYEVSNKGGNVLYEGYVKVQKENSELRKGIEEVIDLCENGYSEEIMLRKLRSLVKKEVK